MKRLSPVVLALVLSVSLCALPACSSAQSDADTQDEAIEKEEDVVLGEDDVSEFDADEVEDEAEVEPQEQAAENTQHVGAAGIGFVDVPASWTEFHDAEGGTDIQWCDGTPYTIVTMNAIDLSATMSEDERANFTLEDGANNIIGHMIEEDGISEEAIQGAHVTLADREAVQVYGMYPDGSYLVFWLLKDDAGIIRYVSAEGTSDTIMDAVGIVEGSYALE